MHREDNMKTLENWSVIHPGAYSNRPPEYRSLHLQGEVSGHDRFKDGTSVITSAITGLEGELVVTRSGSRYKLGDASKRYESTYPDAKKRVLKSLKT